MQTQMQVELCHENAKLPYKSSSLDAGYDLTACENVTIPPWSRKIVPTGLKIAIPEGYYARIAPRSGLSVKKSLDVGAGVCDPGYRGLYGVVLINSSATEYQVNAGDRVAQLVIEKYFNFEVVQKDSLTETTRGEGGFGSSGV